MDLIIRRAGLRGVKGLNDIGISGKRVKKISSRIREKAKLEIDARGNLVAPTFIDPHVHLDKALISEVVRNNVSGTLREAIEIIWEKKKRYTLGDIKRRAGTVVQWAASHGTTVIRTHVDVDTIGKLMPLQGLLEVKKEYEDLADIQIVAFPQEGILKDEGTRELMIKAMEMGADAVLVNTAIATADDPAEMARAFKLAVEAGRLAYTCGPRAATKKANASSPLTGFLRSQ